MDGIEKRESNTPKFTYRIKYCVPGMTEYEIAYIHAEHFEYDKDCVSFLEYDEEMGNPIVTSSIKGWFCVERQEYDTEAKEAALEELKEVFIRLGDTLARHEKQGD